MIRRLLSPVGLVVSIGLMWFATAALHLGEHHASPLWPLAWAMFWSPIFCRADPSFPGRPAINQTASMLVRFSITSLKIFLVLFPLYAAGWLIDP